MIGTCRALAVAVHVGMPCIGNPLPIIVQILMRRPTRSTHRVVAEAAVPRLGGALTVPAEVVVPRLLTALAIPA